MVIVHRLQDMQNQHDIFSKDKNVLEHNLTGHGKKIRRGSIELSLGKKRAANVIC